MVETVEKLRGIVSKHAPELNGKQLQPEDLLSDLGIDSLGFIEMVYDIEDQFDLEIPDTQLSSLKTVGDVLAVVGLGNYANGGKR